MACTDLKSSVASSTFKGKRTKSFVKEQDDEALKKKESKKKNDTRHTKWWLSHVHERVLKKHRNLTR